jgi:hypothetical protein
MKDQSGARRVMVCVDHQGVAVVADRRYLGEDVVRGPLAEHPA